MKKPVLISLLALILCAAIAIAVLMPRSAQPSLFDHPENAASTDQYTARSFVSTALDNSIRGTLDFTGAVTLWQYNAAGEQPLSITCALTIREGAVKLVAYDENGGMTELLSQSASSGLNGAASVLNASLHPGMNTVKLIGARNTKLDFEFTFAPGTP